MAKYKIPFQNLEYDLPDEGQLFRIKGSNTLAKVKGGKIYDYDVTGLSTLPKYTREPGTGIGAGLPTDQGDWTPAQQHLPSALANLKNKYGIDINSLPEFSTGEAENLYKYVGGGLDWASELKNPSPVVPGGTVTRTIDPNNPNAFINKTGDIPAAQAAPENYLQNLLGGKYNNPLQQPMTPPATADSTLSAIRSVFGADWQPAPAFKNLQAQGVYGAVRVGDSPNVFTIGPGGRMETAESFAQRFGTSNQNGIVGVVTPEQAAKLGINPASIYAPPQAKESGAITAERLSGANKPIDMSGATPQPITSPSASAQATIASAQATIQQIAETLKPPATPEVAKQDDLTARIDELLGKETGKAALQTTEEEKAGVKQYTENLKNIQNEISIKTAAFQKLYADIEGKPITMNSIIGAEAQARRVAEADIGFLTAQAQAMQNNINFAKQTAQDAVNKVYQPIEDEINIKMQQLKLIEPALNKQEQQWATASQIYLQQQQQIIADKKAADQQQVNYAITQMGKYQDAGISATDAYATVNQKVQVSPSYKAEQVKAQPEQWSAPYMLGGDYVQKNSKTGEIRTAVNVPTGGGGNTVSIPNTGNIQTDNALLNAFNFALTGTPANRQEQAVNTFSKLIKANDIEGAKAYIIRTAMSGAGVDQQNQAIGRTQAISSLTDIQSLLDQAKQKGVDTNILRGNLENIAGKLGASTNTDLAYIASRIQQQIQVYRRAMTGVAFSPQESAEYAKIFPDITNVGGLNSTKIEGLIDSFNANNRVSLSFYIGDKNYENLYGKAAPALLPSNKEVNNAVTDNLTDEEAYKKYLEISSGQNNQKNTANVPLTNPVMKPGLFDNFSLGKWISNIGSFFKK